MEVKNKKDRSEIREKILRGLDLVSKRLIEKAKQENGELVVLQGNEITRIRFTK